MTMFSVGEGSLEIKNKILPNSVGRKESLRRGRKEAGPNHPSGKVPKDEFQTQGEEVLSVS